MDHIAENILSYLDDGSLRNAELVCKEWRRVIADGMLWKKLIERKVVYTVLFLYFPLWLRFFVFCHCRSGQIHSGEVSVRGAAGGPISLSPDQGNSSRIIPFIENSTRGFLKTLNK